MKNLSFILSEELDRRLQGLDLLHVGLIEHLQQLATYRAALARIYPDRPVECAFLWTDGPVLMPISPALLVRHPPGQLLL